MNQNLSVIFDECSAIEHQLNLANFILSQSEPTKEIKAIKQCIMESREKLLELLHTKVPNILNEKS